jgi:hypothetical protein
MKPGALEKIQSLRMRLSAIDHMTLLILPQLMVIAPILKVLVESRQLEILAMLILQQLHVLPIQIASTTLKQLFHITQIKHV